MELFLVVLLLLPPVFATCVLALPVAGACRLLVGAGWLRRPWQFMLVCPVLMASYPAWSIRADQIRTAACIAANGTQQLECTGELGGLFMDALRWGALFCSLIAGPFLGRYLARRWLKPRNEAQ